MSIRTNGEIQRDNLTVAALRRIADGIEESNKLKKSMIESLDSITESLSNVEKSIDAIEGQLSSIDTVLRGLHL